MMKIISEKETNKRMNESEGGRGKWATKKQVTGDKWKNMLYIPLVGWRKKHKQKLNCQV